MGYVSPAEYEARYYEQPPSPDSSMKGLSLSNTPPPVRRAPNFEREAPPVDLNAVVDPGPVPPHAPHD